ncbi:hypothetical protein OS493_000760 [Desmophyllum pertusum]|uniref:Uncharacterized protein n=1 Tax=Desmophyllum pertusum TaxID=174260 RepID=A0A9X0A7M4_9CNID|nr:hypothetical protein OS493_000760 [Desmophyllum pertusum]
MKMWSPSSCRFTDSADFIPKTGAGQINKPHQINSGNENKAACSSEPSKASKANEALNHVDLDDEAASDDSGSSKSSDSDKESFIDPSMGGSSIEQLLKKPGPVGTQTASSPFTGDQMRAIQQNSASVNYTGVKVARVTPAPRPAGTATPLGLHRPLDRVLEEQNPAGWVR